MPSTYIQAYAVAFLVPAILALLLTPLGAWLGSRLRVVARSGGRRRHAGAISRLGGIGLYVPFLLALLTLQVLPDGWVPPSSDPNELTRLVGLVLGCTLAFGFGLLDDRFDFPSVPQYLMQLLCALVAVATMIFIERVMNPFTDRLLIFPTYLTFALTIFWFMGMMNTVNFLDGLDGLAAGVGAIVSAVLAIHMLREGQWSVALLPLAMLGATLGFLPFNFHPARVFMGSNGAYFLGFALASLGIIAGARMATMLLMLLLPILDVAWLIWQRTRAGKSVGTSDRRHLHYRLLDMGLSQRQIVLGYCFLCAVLGILALAIASRIFKLLVLGTFGACTLLLLWWAGRGYEDEMDGGS